MVRVDGDHANWVLVVILVALALLLAMVSSAGYGDVQQVNPQAAAQADQARLFGQVAAQERKEVRTPSEVWYIARELYQAGKLEGARKMSEKVVAAYPSDPGARMWAKHDPKLAATSS